MAANTQHEQEVETGNYESCRKWWIEIIRLYIGRSKYYRINDIYILNIIVVFRRFPQIEYVSYDGVFMIHLVGEQCVSYFIRCVNEGFNPNTLDGNKNTVFDRGINFGLETQHLCNLVTYGARPRKPFQKNNQMYAPHARLFIQLGLITFDTKIWYGYNTMEYAMYNYNIDEVYNLLFMGGDPHVRVNGEHVIERLYSYFDTNYIEPFLNIGIAFSLTKILRKSQKDCSTALELLYNFI
jgi:hypothetical protein